MNEKLQRLKATLLELEDELAELDSLDDATRSMLEEAAQEIDETLAHHLAEVETGELESESSLAESEPWDDSELSARSRLQEAVGQFETSHPTLYGLVNRLIDALGQMGI
jgi:hypothetical protein